MAESEKLKTSEENVEEQLENVGIVKPLDGGYGWVIVFASFIANMIVDGVIFTVGDALLGLWKADFQTGDAAAALTISILSGSYLLVGPIASALANAYGCRKVTLLGAGVAFFGFICSTIAPKMVFLYLTFGLIGGVGFGLVYLPAIVIVSQYFAEKRALATGLAVCGSGIGTSLFATLNPIIMELVESKWRLFMIYIAISALLCVFAGIFFKPLQPTNKQLEEVAKIAAEYETTHEAEGEKSDGNGYMAPGMSIERLGEQKPFNSERPFLSTLELNAEKTRQKNVWSQADLVNAVARESVASLNRPLSRQDIFYPGSTTSLAMRQRTASESTSSKKSASAADKTAFLVQHEEKTKSNIQLSTIGLQATDEKTAPVGWKSNLMNTVNSLIDFSLLKSPSFMILAISGFLTLSCFYVPYAYLGRHLERVPNLSATQKTLPLSLLGIINIVFRIMCGWISDSPKVDSLMVSNCALMLAGLSTMAVPFFTEFWHFIIFCVPFALGVACFAALRSVICVDLFGLEKLSNAFGVLLLFMGFGAIVGSPIAAFIKDVSGNFDISFYVMGGLMFLSGLICVPLRAVQRWEDNKNANLKGAKDCELQKLNS